MDKKNSISNMKNLLESINPLQRMLNSEGMNKAFDLVKDFLPNTIIHEYFPGQKIEDWVVPKSWKVIKGVIKDDSNKTITSIEENKLFVAPYSEAVKGNFKKNEIAKHLRTREDRPNDFLLEHRNTYDYNLVDWGITLPYIIWSSLDEEKEYFIEIEVEWGDDSMKVAEILIPGKSEKIISFSAHIDELCNDDLSGCVVGMELIKKLQSNKENKYSYQLLLFPEMFGALYYLYNNTDKVKKTIGMLNLETVGAGENICLKKSLKEKSFFEDILELSMQDLYLNFKKINFFEGYVNDEKVFAWPSFNIDGVAIQRFPFNEYHTSSDTLEIINYEYLYEVLEICEKFIFILENDYIPKYINLLPPWLTKRNLYIDKKINPALDKNKLINDLMFAINGSNLLSEICLKHKINFTEAFNYLDQFFKQKIITLK